jgi:hypothetical protein
MSDLPTLQFAPTAKGLTGSGSATLWMSRGCVPIMVLPAVSNEAVKTKGMFSRMAASDTVCISSGADMVSIQTTSMPPAFKPLICSANESTAAPFQRRFAAKRLPDCRFIDGSNCLSKVKQRRIQSERCTNTQCRPALRRIEVAIHRGNFAAYPYQNLRLFGYAAQEREPRHRFVFGENVIVFEISAGAFNRMIGPATRQISMLSTTLQCRYYSNLCAKRANRSRTSFAGSRHLG